jgi:hypothetical protein
MRIIRHKSFLPGSFLGATILSFPLLVGCIEKFNPQISESIDLMVVNGAIIKEDSLQIIKLSRSNNIYVDEWPKVTDCQVWVSDESENNFYFSEKSPGIYSAHIPEMYLTYDKSYILHIVTPDGRNYESIPQEIPKGSPIDSVYFKNERFQSSSEYHEQGLQFYVDLIASEGSSEYYRWELEETYQFRSPLFIDGLWDKWLDTIYRYEPTIDTLSRCWKTEKISGLFSSSLGKLLVKQKIEIPLNYIAGRDPKLNHEYCLRVKQYPLSKEAFDYWSLLEEQNYENGSLYESQPKQSISNIFNINNPDEKVLGYFWVSSFDEKRSFFKGPLIHVIEDYFCEVDTFYFYNFNDSMAYYHKDINFSYYFADYYHTTVLYSNSDRTYVIWGIADPPCYDCRLRGGTVFKPDYWQD